MTHFLAFIKCQDVQHPPSEYSSTKECNDTFSGIYEAPTSFKQFYHVDMSTQAPKSVTTRFLAFTSLPRTFRHPSQHFTTLPPNTSLPPSHTLCTIPPNISPPSLPIHLYLPPTHFLPSLPTFHHPPSQYNFTSLPHTFRHPSQHFTTLPPNTTLPPSHALFTIPPHTFSGFIRRNNFQTIVTLIFNFVLLIIYYLLKNGK